MEIVTPMATERMVASWSGTGSGALSTPAEVTVRGAIIDSWVEPAGTCDWNSRLVLQVAPRGRPRDLLTLEADAALVPDLDWLADLSENLCHGSPVSFQARISLGGKLRVTQMELGR